ncbi:MAG: peptidoglycan DD-metalloendopeptidase family protein [Pseudomonadota bacterium]
MTLGSFQLLTLLALTAGAKEPYGAVLAHPPFATYYTCSEHSAALDFSLGDALGADCVVQAFPADEQRFWLRSFTGDGSRNEDWHGWRKAVLSPCDCEVLSIHINEITNTPGTMTPGRASSVILERADGTRFVVAHIREPMVAAGATVAAGQALALVGNNGYSRHPHIHLGAWRGDQPLQLRFDLTKMADQ